MSKLPKVPSPGFPFRWYEDKPPTNNYILDKDFIIPSELVSKYKTVRATVTIGNSEDETGKVKYQYRAGVTLTGVEVWEDIDPDTILVLGANNSAAKITNLGAENTD